MSKVFKVLRKIILNLEIYTQLNDQSTVRIKEKHFIKKILICRTQKIQLSPFNLLKIYLKGPKNKDDNEIQAILELIH